MSTDMQDRVDRLDAMIEEGRVLRDRWTDGRDRACLLAAISPEAGRAQHAIACPAHVMPAWLAYMTPWIDDEVSAEAWPRIIRRYASLARRWSVLDDAAWERARIASLIAIVSEARTHCPPTEVCALAAIDGVLAWLRRGAPESERAQVRYPAYSAASASAAARASLSARAAASWAAEAAVRAGAVARAGLGTAGAAAATEAAAAARAAVARAGLGTAGSATEAAAAARTAARRVAAARAPDRIATAVLDAIESEIERSEKA